jgi:hypothetical protein
MNLTIDCAGQEAARHTLREEQYQDVQKYQIYAASLLYDN